MNLSHINKEHFKFDTDDEGNVVEHRYTPEIVPFDFPDKTEVQISYDVIQDINREMNSINKLFESFNNPKKASTIGTPIKETPERKNLPPDDETPEKTGVLASNKQTGKKGKILDFMMDTS